MTDNPNDPRHDAEHLETLDRDLGRLSDVEETAFAANRGLAAPAIAAIFIIAAGLLAMLAFGGYELRRVAHDSPGPDGFADRQAAPFIEIWRS